MRMRESMRADLVCRCAQEQDVPSMHDYYTQACMAAEMVFRMRAMNADNDG